MRIYKAGDIEVPGDLNLTELLHSSAQSQLPGSHLIANDCLTGRSITLDGLRDRAGRLAAGLQANFNPVDQSRWALVVPNSVNYIELFHTILWVGGVGCPINWALKPAEIAHAFIVSKPHFVFVYGPAVSKVREAITIASDTARKNNLDFDIPRIITVLGDLKDNPDIEQFLAPTRLPIPHFSNTRERLASIHLSSGTTGNPKGVALSHFNYIANVLQLVKHDPAKFNENVRMVVFTPFVHIANTTIPLFVGPWTGMLHCIMPSYDIETVCRMIQDNKADSVQGMGPIVGSFANTDVSERYDLSSLRSFVGGVAIAESGYKKLLSKGNWKGVKLYGMTEAAPYVVFQKLDEILPWRKIGGLLPGIECVLRIEDGTKDAPEGGPGEMWIRGPNVTSGYVFNEEATKSAFREGGWYNTGDVCTFTPDGLLEVVGRTKELIKYQGFQVPPTELDAYVKAHPAVLDAACAGIWDAKRLTELPAAYVVLQPEIKTTEQKIQALKDVRQMVDSKVSGYKKLRGGVWEVSEVAKNATGKIVRRQLGDHKTGISDQIGSAKDQSKL
ncbi:hypothetical protein FQN57_001240 [Myotisia sp. PD_48]|nr:hypothetical protein FQN57_001240 [Myotisia sp. PD_48]